MHPRLKTCSKAPGFPASVLVRVRRYFDASLPPWSQWTGIFQPCLGQRTNINCLCGYICPIYLPSRTSNCPSLQSSSLQLLETHSDCHSSAPCFCLPLRLSVPTSAVDKDVRGIGEPAPPCPCLPGKQSCAPPPRFEVSLIVGLPQRVPLTQHGTSSRSTESCHCTRQDWSPSCHMADVASCDLQFRHAPWPFTACRAPISLQEINTIVRDQNP